LTASFSRCPSPLSDTNGCTLLGAVVASVALPGGRLAAQLFHVGMISTSYALSCGSAVTMGTPSS
jgi:hypothetical protein